MTREITNASSRRAAWLALLLIALIALAAVVIPVWVIQPFKPQTTRGLAVAMAMRSWSPLITVIALVSALALVVWLWRGSRRWWRKALLVMILLPLFPVTWFARQNHFEWMFHPLPNAAYAKAGEASFINDSDMVLSVENNGEAVAYPVRLMAYHHVVQDVVGGKPIVATY
jgi:uncharacterized membrane protein YozB (DUF420 family)